MEKFVSLDNLKNGAVLEKFNIEFGQVISNLLDPNTDWNKSRKIALVLELKTDEDREEAIVNCVVKSNLQPSKPVVTRVLMAKDESGILASEYSPNSPTSKVTVVDPVTGEVMEDDAIDNVVSFMR